MDTWKPKFLSDSDIVLWQKPRQLLVRLAGNLNTNHQRGPVENAVSKLHDRITSLADTILFICGDSAVMKGDDTAVLLRCMYDTVLQTLYILNSSNLASDRAQLYLDFYWVEKHKWRESFDNSPTAFAQHIAKSPKRIAGEAEIDKNYARVKHNFLVKNGEKTRLNWYPGTLRDIARDTGYEHEYELIQAYLGSIVHSSPFSSLSNSKLSRPTTSMLSWHFLMRHLGAVATAHNIELDEEESYAVELANENWFDSNAANNLSPPKPE